jgi:hypothetical protein
VSARTVNAHCGFVSETISNSLAVFSRVIMEDVDIKSNDLKELCKIETIDNLRFDFGFIVNTIKVTTHS